MKWIQYLLKCNLQNHQLKNKKISFISQFLLIWAVITEIMADALMDNVKLIFGD